LSSLKLGARGLLLEACGPFCIKQPGPQTSEALQPFQVCLTPEAESRVLSLIPGPLSTACESEGKQPSSSFHIKGRRICPHPRRSRLRLVKPLMDQGSVLDVRAFGSLSIYFAPQPEVVPDLIS
jgi:hypothetical protein